MTKKKHTAPGKSSRKGITIIDLLDMFPDEETAVNWFEEVRWPNGRYCPHCGSVRTFPKPSKKPQPYHCRDCRKHFSCRIGTVMESSRRPVREWVIAMYLMTTNLKGVSSMKLHRDLGITQKTAWMMAQKIRQCWIDDSKLHGDVEMDETFVGGKERNKHHDKRSHTRGPSGKTIVAGAKSRETNKVVAKPVSGRTKEEIHEFVSKNVSPEAHIFSDDHKSYLGLPQSHESVNHSVGEYVRGQAHTNGIESFWAMLKRGYNGTYHRMSEKHLERYVTEFAGRHNVREMDTIDQMIFLAKGMVGKKLPYKKLTSPNFRSINLAVASMFSNLSSSVDVERN